MDRYDVIVIGGGPIGAVAAREAAKAGARTLLLEQRKEIKGPIACTGLVSPRTLATLGASSRSILREIRAVRAHSPRGRRLSLRSLEVKGVVIDRISLEEELLSSAGSAGVEVLLGTEGRVGEGGRVTLISRGGEERVGAGVVIGADGPKSRVAAGSGLSPAAAPLPAAQAIVEGAPTEDMVEVYFGWDLAPGFFAWAVPAEPDRSRVGLAVPPGENPQRFLDRLLTDRFPSNRVLSRASGFIPSRPVDRSIDDRLILVGDAAGQVKPLTGGGLYFGGLCAAIAGRVAAGAALSGRTDRAGLTEYEVGWRAALGTEIRFGLAGREALLPLDDDGIDEIFARLDDPELLTFIAETADIDRPSRLISTLVHRPWLWERVLPIIGIMDGRRRAKAELEPLGRRRKNAL